MDSNRGNRARQDPDFENLRILEPILFDAVTLLEEQYGGDSNETNKYIFYSNYFFIIML
jgi:hypothetical protein